MPYQLPVPRRMILRNETGRALQYYDGPFFIRLLFLDKEMNGPNKNESRVEESEINCGTVISAIKVI